MLLGNSCANRKRKRLNLGLRKPQRGRGHNKNMLPSSVFTRSERSRLMLECGMLQHWRVRRTSSSMRSDKTRNELQKSNGSLPFKMHVLWTRKNWHKMLVNANAKRRRPLTSGAKVSIAKHREATNPSLQVDNSGRCMAPQINNSKKPKPLNEPYESLWKSAENAKKTF